MGQVRALKSQLQQDYDTTIHSQHPVMPWVRHAACLLNRYAIHSDGNTSFYRRSSKYNKQPLCEFGETVQHMLPTVKVLPKLEQRFMPGIWLYRQRHSNQRTSHRHHQQGDPSKNHQETTATWEVQSTTDGCHQQKQSQQVCGSRTIHHTTTNDIQTTETTRRSDSHTDRGDSRSSRSRNNDNISISISISTGHTTTTNYIYITSAHLTTSGNSRCTNGNVSNKLSYTTSNAITTKEDSLRHTSRRHLAETTVNNNGSNRTATAGNNDRAPNNKTPHHQDNSTNKTRRRNHGILLWRCHRATNRKDPPRTKSEQRRRTRQGENNWRNETGDPLDEETTSLHRGQRRLADPLTTKQHHTITMGVAWQRQQVQRESNEIYASTPIFCVLRALLTLSCNNGWVVRTGDISTAFLHASAATQDLYMYPPREFYNPTDCVVWKLNKAIYGLRSGPSAWQKHLAEVLQQLGLIHNAAEPNIYMTATRDCYILVYVDGLLLLGQQQTVHNIFNQIQQHLLLRPTGTLHFGNAVSFLGRNITNRGDHFEISLSNDCIDKLPADNNMSTCNPAAAPGIASLKSTATAEHEQPLSTDEHAAFRKAVGKLQWMTYTRSDISYATKELARSLTAPTTADQQKLKHLLRYLQGTKQHKQIIRPTMKIPASATPDLNVYVDSDWAGCSATRRSTTGFVITLLGTTINYGSRTQATIALSSAEAELYAINTGARSTTPTQPLDGTHQRQVSTSESTQIPQQARAWQQESDHHARQNTLNLNTCSSKSWFSTALCDLSRSTPTTTQLTY